MQSVDNFGDYFLCTFSFCINFFVLNITAKGLKANVNMLCSPRINRFPTLNQSLNQRLFFGHKDKMSHFNLVCL